MPAGSSRGAIVKGVAGAAMRHDAPTQVSGIAFSSGPVAQHEQRDAIGAGSQTQSSAGGEIEQFWVALDLGNDGRNRSAGCGLLGGPQKLGHVGDAHDHQFGGINPEPVQAWPIGQAEVFSLICQLHVVDRRALRREQALGLGEGKGEAGTAVARAVGIDFLHEARRQCGEHARFTPWAVGRLRQCRLALDIGNGVPQRGEALLAIRG